MVTHPKKRLVKSENVPGFQPDWAFSKQYPGRSTTSLLSTSHRLKDPGFPTSLLPYHWNSGRVTNSRISVLSTFLSCQFNASDTCWPCYLFSVYTKRHFHLVCRVQYKVTLMDQISLIKSMDNTHSHFGYTCQYSLTKGAALLRSYPSSAFLRAPCERSPSPRSSCSVRLSAPTCHTWLGRPRWCFVKWLRHNMCPLGTAWYL